MEDGSGVEGAPVGRRLVLGLVGLGALGVLTGGRLAGIEQRLLGPSSSGLGSLLPGGGGFRLYTVTGGYPRLPAAGYRLTVDGLVRRPVRLSLAELSRLPRTRLVRDFQCVTGWRVPAVHWAGVALPDLLDAVGVLPGATALQFVSGDGTYTESLTLAQARRRDILVATDMLGAPVSAEHGGPVRLYVAPMYGYKSIKWLTGIRVTDRVLPGYWEHWGYAVDAWVGRSNGRTDAPT